MSNYIKQLLEKASQIADSTQENCDIMIVEKYYSLHNLWLRYSPVPSRPILNTAWFEAGVLAETSIFLALHGFYEQACATLRMQLDGFLTRLYWDTLDKRIGLESYYIEDRLTTGYWEWESGKVKDFPSIKNDVWPTLRKEKYLDSFDSRYQIKVDIDNQNQLLNKYIHGRPPSRHDPGSTRSSVMNIKFEKKRFDRWFELFKTNFDFMILISVLLYPEYIKQPSWREFILLTP